MLSADRYEIDRCMTCLFFHFPTVSPCGFFRFAGSNVRARGIGRGKEAKEIGHSGKQRRKTLDEARERKREKVNAVEGDFS